MNFCTKCGKGLDGDDDFCQNCGQPVKRSGYNQSTRESSAQYPPVSNSMCDSKTERGLKTAKLSGIFGVLAILLLSPFAFPAIILANKSKNILGYMTKQAKTGMICSIIALVFWGIMIVVYISSLSR